MTLLLVAVSFVFSGCSSVQSAGRDPFVAPVVAPSDASSEPPSTDTSSADASLSTTEAQALDAQLRAIESELDSLKVPGESGTDAIEEGLN